MLKNIASMHKDMLAAIVHHDSWLYMGWYDVLSKYRRTILGPFWSIIITAISILCIAVFWSLILRVPIREFLPYVASGIIVWGYISTIINESCNIFINSAGLLQNNVISLFSICFRMFCRNTILFFHNAIILILCLLLFGDPVNNNILLLFISFSLILLNSVAVSIVLGFLSTRYRDTIYIVQSLLNILMMLTPVIWKVEMLGNYAFLADFNPFTHFIASIRNPVLGLSIGSFSMTYLLSITVINYSVMSYLYIKFKNKLVFWL